MKKTIGLILFLFFLNEIYAEDFKEIEECVSIENNEARLKCFDSFFISDKKLILVDQEQVIFEEKQSPKTDERVKLKIQAERSIIEKNLVLVGVRFTGISYIFELNDQSFWRNIETLRKKDIPTPGDRVELQSGMFGSTFLKIKGKKNKIRIKKEKT